LLVMLLVLPVALAQAAPEIMPVGEVKAGMHGIAKTVVSGTNIEEFGVEVLGVMKNKGPAGDLILVRTYGDLIERTGGIAQGMSGSPVYIDNKLLGAIAYGWSFADHRVGMVTPIADMLKLWEMPAEQKAAALPGNAADEQDLAEEATPLMAAGFSEGALSLLRQKLKPLNLEPYAVGETPQGVEFGPLQPGSAVGVQLVRGDVSLGALGTVTYVEGNKVLAFGHPFLKKGISGYFMTNAYVFTTVNGVQNSFKVGTTGAAVGIIGQDRGAGVAGELERFPGIVPLSIVVKDAALNRIQSATVEVVRDEQLSPVLATAAVFSVVEKTMDRGGEGTARVSFEISARNMPGDIFKRENMFYSPAGIGELSVAEIHEVLSVLASNQFQSVDVLDVKVNITVDSERRTASIMQARASTASAKPGDTVNISVQLKPYRGEAITRVVPFTIPKDQPGGPMALMVRGGGTIPLLELLAKQQNAEGELLRLVGKAKQQTFEDVIKDLADRDRNNDIVVEIMDNVLGETPGNGQAAKTPLEAGPNPTADGGKKAQRSARMPGGGKKAADKKNHISTEYIINSDAQVMINIEGDTKAPKAGASTADSETKRLEWR
jgi:hypothetical protein